MRLSLKDWCIENNKEELLSEWDYDKNGELTPEQCGSASGKKVWWKCEKGHSWEAIISNRTKRNQGCPYCSGHRVLSGINDLATLYPSLIREWDFEKNTEFLPSEVAPQSDKFVWWICDKGHSWKTQIKHRTKRETGCPVCANKVVLAGYNDLATTHPSLIEEWDYEKNVDISPTQVTFGSDKIVWWKCEKGHSWQVRIGEKVKGNQCPYCSKKKYIKETLVGGVLIPEREVSGRKVIEGHNDLVTLYPSLMKEWDFEKNSDISPNKIGRGSELKVWWKCSRGHSWQAIVSNRVKGINCPICSKNLQISIGEKTILYYMKQLFSDVRENYHIEWLGKSELDIYVPSLKLAVEYDGARWHKNISADIKKDDLCQTHGITLIRVREAECSDYLSTSIKYYLKNDSDSELASALVFIFQIIRDKYKMSNFPEIDINKSKEIVYAMLYQTEITNSISNLYPHLVEEWDYEKNGDVKPNMVYAKSKIKVWWRCKLGHSWQAVVHARSNGGGCPICAGKKVLAGFNDLATHFPNIAKEWHPTKNILQPTEVTAKSNKKVWWLCENGHEWESKINNRTANKQGCPICYKERRKKK